MSIFEEKNIARVSVSRVYLRQSVLYSLFFKILNMQFSTFQEVSVCQFHKFEARRHLYNLETHFQKRR